MKDAAIGASVLLARDRQHRRRDVHAVAAVELLCKRECQTSHPAAEVERAPARDRHAAFFRALQNGSDFVEAALIERVEIVSTEPLFDISQNGEERISPGEAFPMQRQPVQPHDPDPMGIMRSRSARRRFAPGAARRTTTRQSAR
jgi:hypothetical protein